MSIDERAAFTTALELASRELYQRVYLLAKLYPDVVRRGPQALAQAQLTPAQKTAIRQSVRDAGDPMAVEGILQKMVSETSFQETSDLLGGGRAANG